jgi:ABC-type transporter Mla subunit MlaD
MAELDRTLKAVQSAAAGLDRAGNSVASFADGASQDLRPALQQAERTMKDLSAATVALEKQATQLSQSIGSTVTSGGDQVSAAVAELRSTGAALNRLIDRLQDPRAALLGPSPAQRGPGE